MFVVIISLVSSFMTILLNLSKYNFNKNTNAITIKY